MVNTHKQYRNSNNTELNTTLFVQNIQRIYTESIANSRYSLRENLYKYRSEIMHESLSIIERLCLCSSAKLHLSTSYFKFKQEFNEFLISCYQYKL